MLLKHHYIYAVYDSKGNFVKAYTRYGDAKNKVNKVNGKIVEFVNTKYRFGVEMVEFMSRGAEQ